MKQHTQQIKRRIAFAVQQDIEQLLCHCSQGGFASSTHSTLSPLLVVKQAPFMGFGKTRQECLKSFEVKSRHCPYQPILLEYPFQIQHDDRPIQLLAIIPYFPTGLL